MTAVVSVQCSTDERCKDLHLPCGDSLKLHWHMSFCVCGHVCILLCVCVCPEHALAKGLQLQAHRLQ